MLTLAPEADPDARVTQYLSDEGVIVAAGHSDASREQLRRGIDHGLRLFTHLGNGCPSSLPRHDNIIQRVLSLSEDLMVSFIADGHHVPVFALRNYLRCVPDDNVVIVTDAISAAGLGPGRYELSGQIVEVDHDGAAWAACRTHFAGCATTLPKMIDVLKHGVGASDLDIQRWMKLTHPGCWGSHRLSQRKGVESVTKEEVADKNRVFGSDHGRDSPPSNHQAESVP